MAHREFPRSWKPKTELCHHHGDQQLVNSVVTSCAKELTLTSQHQVEPKRELCHHHGHRRLVDFSSPVPMEILRGSSAIIMEFRIRTHLIYSSICSRHLGSLTAANWVSFDLNVSYSSC